MNLAGIADYLVAQRLGVIGKTIFVNEMPLECERGILLRHRYSGTPIDHELPGYRATGFRLAVRSRDYNDGYALALQVVNALTIQVETQMTGMLVKQILPQEEPRPYRRTKGGYVEWESTFDANYVLT